MLALAYSFAVFLVWTLVGRALFALAAPRFGALRSWLLAPGVGLAVFLLALMFLNQLGWPIARFTWPMTLGLIAGAVAVLTRRRPAFPTRILLLFFGAALFSLLWTGWPALAAGFNWISYGNDDMANYCLAAERFATSGFYDVPTMAQLSGRDYSSYYFFMHVADMMRFGAEHIVAWTASLARLKATQAFMPTILALALAQLFAAAGLALQAGRHRRRALAAAWILAACPLFMLGTLYQLIAQVAGIALLLVTLALLTRTWGTAHRRDVMRYAMLPAFAAAALCICYPEPTPFLGLAYFGYLAVGFARRRISPAIAVALIAYVMLGVVVLLRHNVISYVSTLVMQLGSATHVANLLLSLFPYFLLPTGFSNFFGWMPIAKDFPEPVVTLSIAGGMVLSLVLLWQVLRESWRLSAAALLLLVQTAIAAHLYRGGNDFPLYKLAMWMQPTLAIALAGIVLRLRSRRAALIAIALFALSTAPSAFHYTRASEGQIAGGMTELRFGSEFGLHIPAPADPNAQITAAIENVVAAKFAAAELRGHQLALASRDYFFPNTRVDFRDPPFHVLIHPHYDEMKQARPRMVERNSQLIKTSMLWLTEFSQPVLARETDHYLFLARQLSLFNKFGHDPAAPIRAVFDLQPAADIRNQLIFVHSGRGNHYYLGDRRFISFFQQEADPFNRGGDFNGLGRFMLLRVEHPTEEIYLRIAATRTVLPGRTEWKPSTRDENGRLHGPVIHAENDLPLNAVGSGAFNLFVGPLRPRKFLDAHYVAIDFAEITQVILDRRQGLKALYNRFVPLDYRRLLGWARDISAISAEEYGKLSRPARLSTFPQDIATASTLEFSGIYEDGWLSPQSRFVLGRMEAEGILRLRGFIPAIPGTPLGTGVLRLTVGGREIELPAANGPFDWLVPAPRASPTTPVSLHFTASVKLPGGDDRPTAAKLELLEILPALSSRIFDYGTVGAPRLASNGIDQDGWMTTNATIEIPALATPASMVLRFDLAAFGGTAAGKVKLQLPGSAAEEQPLPLGPSTVRLLLPASPGPRTLQLTVGPSFPLPAPDLRPRACRLLQAELVPGA